MSTLDQWEADLNKFHEFHDPYSADPKYLDLERRYLQLSERQNRLIDLVRKKDIAMKSMALDINSRMGVVSGFHSDQLLDLCITNPGIKIEKALALTEELK